MHIRLVFTIILAVISLYAQGQNTLTKEVNAMRDNDRMSYMTFVPVHHWERWKQRNMGFQSSSNSEKQQQRLLFCRLSFSYFHDGQLWQAVFQDDK